MDKRITHVTVTTALLLFLALAAAVAARGESQDVNSSAKGEVVADENIAYRAVSSELVRIAEDSRDAILMLAAARLEAMAVSEEVTRSKTAEGGNGEGAPEPKREDPDLYALAEELAGTNEQLHAVIEHSKSSSMAGSRGNARGPQYSTDSVLAYGTDVYRIAFQGGRLAEVLLSGDRDTDLDLFVYDEYGNEVCSDTSFDDQEQCSWRPLWTGVFTIEIENLGSVYNVYTLMTN